MLVEIYGHCEQSLLANYKVLGQTLELVRYRTLPLKSVYNCWHFVLQRRRKLIFFGNGGSAAMAQHFAAECVVKLSKPRAPIAAIALTADTAIITACGNDLAFERIFSRQIEAIAQEGDCLVALSTSGRSPNVLHALQMGVTKGCLCTMLTGADAPSHLDNTCRVLRILSTDTARIQEMHLLLGHTLIGALEKELEQ